VLRETRYCSEQSEITMSVLAERWVSLLFQVAILTFQVYDNIGFEALGALLGLDAEAAEATACK
jgi:hypothetical protein